jgi:hypothetical protein
MLWGSHYSVTILPICNLLTHLPDTAQPGQPRLQSKQEDLGPHSHTEWPHEAPQPHRVDPWGSTQHQTLPTIVAPATAKTRLLCATNTPPVSRRGANNLMTVASAPYLGLPLSRSLPLSVQLLHRSAKYALAAQLVKWMW